MKLGAIAAGVGVTTEIKLNFLPQFLRFTAAGAVQSIVVEVLGLGIIMDLDDNGIQNINAGSNAGQNAALEYVIPVSLGLMIDKNVVIRVRNGDAAGFDLFGFSEFNDGEAFVSSMRQTTFANSGIDVTDFSLLGLINAGASDTITLEHEDGLSQQINRDDLAGLGSLDINQVRATSVGANVLRVVNNSILDNKVRRVNYIPASETTIYVQRIVMNVA